jgi:hypothetical protein
MKRSSPVNISKRRPFDSREVIMSAAEEFRRGGF